MQAIWVVWEYNNGIVPDSCVFDVFLSKKVANKCVQIMNKKQNGCTYEVEKFYVHSEFMPDEDQ